MYVSKKHLLLLFSPVLIIFLIEHAISQVNDKTNKETESISFIEKAESRLYHPDDSELTSLKFIIRRNLPSPRYPVGQKFWEIEVQWLLDGGERYSVDISEDAPIPIALKKQLQQSLPTVGETILYEQMNRYASHLLITASSSYQGEEDKLHKIAFTKNKLHEIGFKEKVLYYDVHNVLRKANTVMEDNSNLVESYSWKECPEQPEKLILNAIVTRMKVQSIEVTRETYYNFEKVGDYYFFTSQTSLTEGIPNMPSIEEKLVIHSFVINGKTAE